MADNLVQSLDERQNDIRRDKENSARLAFSFAQFTSTGQGTSEHPNRVAFGLTFVERPMVSYGTYCDMDDLAELFPELDDEDDVLLPNASGYVTQWDTDERGFYLGCWIAARVTYDALDAISPELQPVVEHHYTFAGVAMKDVDVELSSTVSGGTDDD